MINKNGNTTSPNVRGGVFFKGKRINNGSGLYLSTTPEFFRGGLQDVSRTLKAETHDAGVASDYRIRKLTPRECFRLMNVSDLDIDKIQAADISKSQQYKLAGNSIVVNCLYYLFRNMFIPEFMADPMPPQTPKIVQPSLFDGWDDI